MKIKWTCRWILAGALVLIFLAGMGGRVSARSYSADRFDVMVEVQPDGSLFITETIDFRFEGGPYTYVLREINLNELDSIEISGVQLDGELLPRGSQTGQVEVEGGDPVRVTWHFAPASDRVVTTTLRYHVTGNIRPASNGDLLYWQAIPADHEYEIKHSTITVVYPESLELTEKPQLDGRSGNLTESAGWVVWEIGPVPADQYVSLKVNFPPGSLVGAPPQWYAKKQAVLTAAKSALPWAAGIGLGLTGVTSLLLIRALRRNRGEEIQKIPLGIINRPPGEQPPMLVSALMTYGRSIFPSTIGGLLSLCQRGWLEIRETGKKGLFGGRDFVFVQTRADVLELMEHERSLLQILFEDRQGRRDEVPITRLGMDLSRSWKKLNKILEAELTGLGLVIPEQIHQKKKVQRLGLGLYMVTMILFTPALFMIFNPDLTFYGVIAMGILAGMLLTGGVATVFGTLWNILTPQGKILQGRWMAFQKYLVEQSRANMPLQVSWLEEFLPYAVAFELGNRWVRAFARQGMRAMPVWLKPLNAMDEMALMMFIGTASSIGSGGSSTGTGGGGGGGSSSAG